MTRGPAQQQADYSTSPSPMSRHSENQPVLPPMSRPRARLHGRPAQHAGPLPRRTPCTHPGVPTPPRHPACQAPQAPLPRRTAHYPVGPYPSTPPHTPPGLFYPPLRKPPKRSGELDTPRSLTLPRADGPRYADDWRADCARQQEMAFPSDGSRCFVLRPVLMETDQPLDFGPLLDGDAARACLLL
ncbi:unnamed protein product [Boreogadus saida]